MATLAEVFELTGGPDASSPAIPDTAASPAFLRNFSTAQFTGGNGSGPILNANAVLMPDRASNYHDNSTANDYRLGNGIGVARAFSKPDSMAGQSLDGFQGMAVPNKMFGRSTKSHDMAWSRDDHRERAGMALKKVGFKTGEVPTGAQLQPWQWQNHTAMGIGSAMGNGKQGSQYNRNYALPDADAVARRLYTPAPSCLTQMLATDVEEAALRPNSTRLHPMKVISEDRQREQMIRIPRNTDVRESVLYENIMPRGMGSRQSAVRVYGDTDALLQPVGTNETGDRSVLDRWGTPYNCMDPLAVSTLEDRLQLFKDGTRNIRGQEFDQEIENYYRANRRLDEQLVYDPNNVQPVEGEYPRNMEDTKFLSAYK